MIFNPLKEIIVVDIETTGFSSREDEILSLCAVTADREVIFNEHFKPARKKSWEGAQKVHGITPSMVRHCKPFSDFKERLRAMFANKIVLFYNESFDAKFLRYELEKARTTFCLMKAFAEHYREVNPHDDGKNKGKWRYKKLSDAMTFFGATFEGDPHSAKADALGALDVFLGLVEEGRDRYQRAHPHRNQHTKHDYVVLNTMAYLGTEHGEVIGLFRGCNEDYCRQVANADYENPEYLLLCQKHSGNILIPIPLEPKHEPKQKSACSDRPEL